MAAAGGSWSAYRPKGGDTFYIHVRSGETKKQAIHRYKSSGYSFAA